MPERSTPCPYHPEVDGRLDRIEQTSANTFEIVTRLERIDGPIGRLNERMAVQERIVGTLHDRQDGFNGRLQTVEVGGATARKTSIAGAVTGGAGGLIVILLLAMKILGYIG